MAASTYIDAAGINVALSANATLASTTDIVTLYAGTLSLSSFTLTCGIFRSNVSTARTIAFGTGKISLTAASTVVVWSASTITGLTITGTPNVEVVGGGVGTIKYIKHGDAAGGSESLAINVATAPGFVGTLEISAVASPSWIGDLNIADIISTITLPVATNIFGSLTIGGATPTINWPAVMNFLSSSGTKTITMNGRVLGATSRNSFSGVYQTNGSFNASSSINVDGGSFTLGGNSSASTYQLNGGVLDLNGYSLTCSTFASSNANTRTLAIGSGTLTVSAGPFNCGSSTNLTVTGTGTIRMTSSTTKSFSGGSKTWPILDNAGAGALIISGSNTFTTIGNSVQPTTFTFTAGTTQTVDNFNVSGTAGNLVTINSTSAGAAPILSKSSGTVTANYCSIQNNTATGGATWSAINSTRMTGVSGWRFTFTRTVLETSTAQDALLRALLWNLINDSQTANWQNTDTAQPATWGNVADSYHPGWTPTNT